MTRSIPTKATKSKDTHLLWEDKYVGCVQDPIGPHKEKGDVEEGAGSLYWLQGNLSQDLELGWQAPTFNFTLVCSAPGLRFQRSCTQDKLGLQLLFLLPVLSSCRLALIPPSGPLFRVFPFPHLIPHRS